MRWPRVSLRNRITFWVVLIFALIQTTTQAVFVLHQRSTVNDSFDRELGNRARAVADVVSKRVPSLTRADIGQIITQELRFARYETVTLSVFDETGRNVVKDDADGLTWQAVGLTEVPAGTLAKITRLQSGGTHASQATATTPRVATAGVTGMDGLRYAVVLASSETFVQRQLSLINQLAAVSSVIGLFAAVLSARLIAGIAVAPLERLRDVAQHLGPESIGQRVQLASDVTEVARLSEELDKARIRIQDSMLAKERFLSNVSHEIKTPIAVLLLESQTLDRSGCSQSMLRFVKTVEEETARLGKLVESFLTLTRIQSGRGPAILKRYCLNDMVSDSIESCSLMATQHQVSLKAYLLDRDDVVDAAVIGDPDLLRTLVDNLARNSIRFSPVGGVVEIAAGLDGGDAWIRLRDEGPGIPPDRLDTIFDRFAQSRTSERQGRGHGLGLSIAKGIAELHGGTIEASNRQEGGCEFVVRLRRAASGNLPA